MILCAFVSNVKCCEFLNGFVALGGGPWVVVVLFTSPCCVCVVTCSHRRMSSQGHFVCNWKFGTNLRRFYACMLLQTDFVVVCFVESVESYLDTSAEEVLRTTAAFTDFSNKSTQPSARRWLQIKEISHKKCIRRHSFGEARMCYVKQRHQVKKESA